MKPVIRWVKHNFNLMPLLLALLLLLVIPSSHAEQDELGLEDTSDLEFIEIDQILSEDENAPQQPVADKKAAAPVEEPAEEKEFVDLDKILYGEGGQDSAGAAAAGDTQQERKTMQQDMESLKDKVLQVNRDLFVLEEDLLYPSSTQVNVFVSFDALPYFQLDGVTIKINDRPVSNHLYTERELKAMNRGAVQRLFTGNLPVGEHELVAIVSGVGPEGRDYKRAVSVEFEKTSGTKYIELKIEGDNLRQQPTFRLKQWE